MSTELLIEKLLLLERVYRARGDTDTADVLKASAERLHDLERIGEFYHSKINVKGKRKK